MCLGQLLTPKQEGLGPLRRKVAKSYTCFLLPFKALFSSLASANVLVTVIRVIATLQL